MGSSRCRWRSRGRGRAAGEVRDARSWRSPSCKTGPVSSEKQRPHPWPRTPRKERSTSDLTVSRQSSSRLAGVHAGQERRRSSSVTSSWICSSVWPEAGGWMHGSPRDCSGSSDRVAPGSAGRTGRAVNGEGCVISCSERAAARPPGHWRTGGWTVARCLVGSRLGPQRRDRLGSRHRSVGHRARAAPLAREPRATRRGPVAPVARTSGCGRPRALGRGLRSDALGRAEDQPAPGITSSDRAFSGAALRIARAVAGREVTRKLPPEAPR